jgi:hypothetical protein
VEVEGDGRRWRFDADFLTSTWECIYGRGCRGCHVTQDVLRADGCCTTGTQFTDGEDWMLVSGRVDGLDASVWQFHQHAQKTGWWKQMPGGSLRTRTVDGACVFLNRPGFATGPGCALHHDAARKGEDVMLAKPNVCWQFPLHSEQVASADTGDGAADDHVVTEVRPWTRDDWTGASNYDWWCTDAPEAREGSTPVYRTMETELRTMCGDQAYEALVCALTTAD